MINPKGKVDTYYDKINMFDVRLNKGKISRKQNFQSWQKIKSRKFTLGQVRDDYLL